MHYLENNRYESLLFCEWEHVLDSYLTPMAHGTMVMLHSNIYSSQGHWDVTTSYIITHNKNVQTMGKWRLYEETIGNTHDHRFYKKFISYSQIFCYSKILLYMYFQPNTIDYYSIIAFCFGTSPVWKRNQIIQKWLLCSCFDIIYLWKHIYNLYQHTLHCTWNKRKILLGNVFESAV